MPLDPSLIDKLGEASLEAKNLLREVHAANKDLKQTIREARAELEEMKRELASLVADMVTETESFDMMGKVKELWTLYHNELQEMNRTTDKAKEVTMKLRKVHSDLLQGKVFLGRLE